MPPLPAAGAKSLNSRKKIEKNRLPTSTARGELRRRSTMNTVRVSWETHGVSSHSLALPLTTLLLEGKVPLLLSGMATARGRHNSGTHFQGTDTQKRQDAGVPSTPPVSVSRYVPGRV